jgi:SPP1 family phage portal protein
MEKIKSIIRAGAMTALSERQFFEKEIAKWKSSDVRKNQIAGVHYFRGNHDILYRQRTVIGRDGRLQEVHNLPNNRIVDNQYAKMVNQKTDYLLGQPFALQVDNVRYENALKSVFNRKFLRTLQNLGKDSLNCGVGWLYIFYDEDGRFSFRTFPAYEILPFWRDAEHTVLDCVVRVYEVEAYEGQESKIVEKVEIYNNTGIERYVLADGALVDDVENPSSDYMTLTDASGNAQGYNWGRIPLVAFKYNDGEIPLICKLKSLQDAINTTVSDYQNNMQEDSRNTILIIKNYDGENLAEFRHNLAAYGAVKVRTIDGSEGGVDALRVDVNSENYRILLSLLKKAVIENAMGYDSKDDKMSGSPNQMNIMSMYSDIDLDANGMETEYQASFEDLLWFVNVHLANSGQGNFEGDEVEIIFNRDMLMNEADTINNVRNSAGILSNETLVAQHPWVTDVSAELDRIDGESREKADIYGGAFTSADKQPEGDAD